jgi:hypothetical protein
MLLGSSRSHFGFSERIERRNKKKKVVHEFGTIYGSFGRDWFPFKYACVVYMLFPAIHKNVKRQH